MRTRIAAFACLALVLAGAGPATRVLAQSPNTSASASSTPCRTGLVTVQVPLPSGVKVYDNHVDVLLPSSYCNGKNESYPVLYVLGGDGDTYQSWVDNTDLVSFAQPYQVIIVMPDGGHGSNAGWYSDWIDGQYQYETYDTSVLPGYVNSTFRTRPDDIAVAGESMGGFGAMSYASRHPGMYKAAASFSGAVDMLYADPVSGIAFPLLNSEFGTPTNAVWGDQLTDYQVWADHNPTSLAANLSGTKLFIASGTGTPGGAEGDNLADATDYVLENVIFQMNLAFVIALDQAGVQHTDDFYLGGYHGWPYWQADLHWVLPQIVSILGSPDN